MPRTITITDDDTGIKMTAVLADGDDNGPPIVWSVQLTATGDRGILPEDLRILDQFGLRRLPRADLENALIAGHVLAPPGERLQRIDVTMPVDRPVDNVAEAE